MLRVTSPGRESYPAARGPDTVPYHLDAEAPAPHHPGRLPADLRRARADLDEAAAEDRRGGGGGGGAWAIGARTPSTSTARRSSASSIGGCACSPERLDALTVMDPKPHPAGRAFFGAWVTVEREDGEERTYRLVGPDEIDMAAGADQRRRAARARAAREAGGRRSWRCSAPPASWS